MISVGFQAGFATAFKSFFLSIAAPIGLAAFLCSAAPGIAGPVTTPYNSGFYYTPGPTAVSPGPAQVNSTGLYIPPCNTTSGYTGYRPFYYTPGDTPAPPAYNTPGYTSYPSYYNSPFYNAPVYNAPWEGGGFYFGPTGSASFL